ncbi:MULTISPECIES: LytTR family transcriptional regulator DNA-binding domain-containing protein [Aquimarina]|uniref:LytTR family transcriptional regulator DNA-binding domain-containing protein n=1 Tax=Aquimarina TaxID=290174 RepID=UPI0009F30963|nr:MULTISPECIES: LytTR family transcriptional regulator DNA-binding domain-containing protein [Aquimarina]
MKKNENYFRNRYWNKAFEEKLDERFIRVHRSYIINKDKIAAYTKNDIEIGNIEISIGENFRNNLTTFLI